MTFGDSLTAARDTAIPLASPLPDGLAIGTGFLAHLNGSLALFTAAHVPTGHPPTADAAWTTWPAAMHAYLSEHDGVRLELFIDSPGLRLPLFRYLRADGNRLADMMAFTGPAHAAPLAHLARRYAPVELLPSSEWSIELGDTLHCFGYPYRGPGTPWPYSRALDASGPIRGMLEGPIIEAECEAIPGHSGGPVFDDHGTFVGMQIGHNDERTRIVPGFPLSALGRP